MNIFNLAKLFVRMSSLEMFYQEELSSVYQGGEEKVALFISDLILEIEKAEQANIPEADLWMFYLHAISALRYVDDTEFLHSAINKHFNSFMHNLEFRMQREGHQTPCIKSARLQILESLDVQDYLQGGNFFSTKRFSLEKVYQHVSAVMIPVISEGH